ncbi:hypothetical protein ACWT_6831 [Actinoplanes sp. SE50]|uniref:hypothetical protein n=1 Tax=unclassified Actinoplanes TaxID=2626549 RepID=UPI00023ED322|nr:MULTISPECIES: hypothetical protein [unclassified Actinoplanes]AEV87844.1 hypothetical protein ACPL_6962 [Actinoplanes sp. SE50/110]ATO86246.1 hypothetical protein ACWT_6831 [Actinoplanes sp. SE50]SLM03661.1 hypothetical protein ACSP50_6957 [Actinoplanes sp. SE50/110]
MSNFLIKAGDRLLARVLRTEVAGACVPDHGQSCGSITYVCHLGRLYKHDPGRVQCNGQCVTTVTYVGTCD